MTTTIQIISVEGNIGSGKSTLLDNLKKEFRDKTNIIFLKEPVDEWSNIKDENGITILEKFYADQEKYSFPFQMMAYISRLKLLKDTVTEIKLLNNDKEKCGETIRYVIITERSLYTDKMVFAKMLYDSGKIEHVNYQIYLNWFNTFAEEFCIDKIIYVKAEPEICQQRIHKRNRNGENNIPIEYLQSCNEYHQKMLEQLVHDNICQNQNHLILNGNDNIYENNDILGNWIESIRKFICV